jgi:uncharacterized protein with HEPN domain
MPHKERDSAYLWDMLDAAKTVVSFTSGVKFHQYEKDRKLQLAIERAIEIIGEAAGRVSKEFQNAHPNIPWRGLIGQRNVLAHEYGDIKQERMWIVVAERIPELIAILEPLVPPEPKAE